MHFYGLTTKYNFLSDNQHRIDIENVTREGRDNSLDFNYIYLWTGDGPDGLFENQVLTNGYLLLRPKEREKPAFYIENINALGVNGRSFEVQMQDKWDLKEKATLQGKNHAQFMDVGKLGKSWPYPKTPERNVMKLLEVISNQNSKKRIPYANVIDGTNIESNWKFPSKLVFDVGPMVPGVTH